MSDQKPQGLLDILRDSKSKGIAAWVPPLIMAGTVMGGVKFQIDAFAADIRDLQAQTPTVYRLTADVAYVKESVTELKKLESDHYEDLRASLTDIQKQLYARSMSPTAMPAAAMGPHAGLKAME